MAPKNLDFVREEHLRQIEEHMKEIVALARGCQISIEDLKEMLDYMAEEE